MNFRTILLLVALALLLALLHHTFPVRLDSFDRFHLVYTSVLLVLIGGGVLFVPWEKTRAHLRDALVWVGIFLVIILAYAARDELLPTRARVQSDGTLTLRADAQNHFYVDAEVNATSVRFLIDTGASDIVLSPRDAKRIGFDPKTLAFNKRYQTANGYSQGASITIHRLTIGNTTYSDLPASINSADMDHSLLGMEFLKHLQSYRVEGRTLTLVP